MHEYHLLPTSRCFMVRDLYTTFFGGLVNDEIERKLFGEIDNTGSKAVRAYIAEKLSDWHHHFSSLFEYIDAQKIRTPKGLDWIEKHYSELDQIQLMQEMQAIRNSHCTIWSEGVREIVSAKDSAIKFILSDHPVTIYNRECPPDHNLCIYPNDPAIALNATQTIFPLDMNHCLILSNLDYAKTPTTVDPIEKREYARNFKNSMVRTDTLIRSRFLNSVAVEKINYIIKSRARRYVAATEKAWLYPERNIKLDWANLHDVLLPPKEGLWKYGGEMYVGYEDGSTYYQDAYGRTTPENKYLKKLNKKRKMRPNDLCGCGSGEKYKKCCRNKSKSQRPSWNELSIRERNLIFCNGIRDIIGLSTNKSWDDVRRELDNEQVKNIHELYEYLWPIDTDITSLLPKPDMCLRALYTGLIDPRAISQFALSSTLYFDEILIQNPFVHPTNIKPEFNPINSPHQYKQQTLKNIILILNLEPFIDLGYINFIPDICSFDSHLHKQMLDLAEERSNENEIPKNELATMEKLLREDFARSIWLRPRDSQRDLIRSANPSFSQTDIERLLEYIEHIKLGDPYTLLQDDVFGEDGGQLTLTSMSPNFEMSLYISQITGSILLTDSLFRWREIIGSQNRSLGIISSKWNKVISFLSSLEYGFSSNPDYIFDLRRSGRTNGITKIIGKLYCAIQKELGPEDVTKLEDSLCLQFNKAHSHSQQEIMKVAELNENHFGDKAEHLISGKITCLAPIGGITHANTQRMLLSRGESNYLENVPMAIYVEPIETNRN